MECLTCTRSPSLRRVTKKEQANRRKSKQTERTKPYKLRLKTLINIFVYFGVVINHHSSLVIFLYLLGVYSGFGYELVYHSSYFFVIFFEGKNHKKKLSSLKKRHNQKTFLIWLLISCLKTSAMSRRISTFPNIFPIRDMKSWTQRTTNGWFPLHAKESYLI